jgi:hypothetical protein
LDVIHAGENTFRVYEGVVGHKTLAMFLRYSHLDREQGEDAMKRLDRFLAGRNKSDRPKTGEQET